MAFYFIAPYGIIALAWSFVCLSFTRFVILQMIMDTLIELKWVEYVENLARQLIISITMAFVVCLFYIAVSNSGMDEIVLLALLIAIGIISYALMTLAFNTDYLKELKCLIAKDRSP